MSTKKSADTSFRDLVARLNAMSNMTPEQERAELMEAANSEPKVLDDKDISLADIAKLAGIKEYVEPAKVSKKAEKLVESMFVRIRAMGGLLRNVFWTTSLRASSRFCRPCWSRYYIHLAQMPSMGPESPSMSFRLS